MGPLRCDGAIARVGAEIVRENPGHAPEFLPPEIAAQLVAKEPAGWNSTAGEDPSRWAELWANEILPVAREAHARLQYSGVQPKEDYGVILAAGFVREKTAFDRKSYAVWSEEVAYAQIARAGWRLAALLETALP